MPIPDASLPGYAALKMRVEGELGLLREGRSIDYKRSAVWDDLRWKIIKTCLAMANLRDGGMIVVGVAEEGPLWRILGMLPEHLKTFDVDGLVGAINAYASRPLPLEIVTLTHDGVALLVIAVGPLQGTPIICKRTGPDSVPQKDRPEEGAIYIRSEGLAQTKKVSAAAEMQELVEMAAEIRAGELLAAMSRIERAAGLPVAQAEAVDAEAFKKERGDL